MTLLKYFIYEFAIDILYSRIQKNLCRIKFNSVNLSNLTIKQTFTDMGEPAVTYSVYCNGAEHTFTLSTTMITHMKLKHGVDMDIEILSMIEHEIQYNMNNK